MRQEKLEDLFDYLPKSKIKAGDGLDEGKYPFYTSSEIQSKYLNEFQHTPGCLVFGTGGKASVHLTTKHFATSTDCITVKPKPNAKIDARYVFQYFKANMQVLENGFKGAGLKHISKAYLSGIHIPHPEEVADQVRIAHLLGKVEGLIAQRKQHLQQLDDLLKSVFLGMFGPTNPDYEVWPLVEIRELAAKHKGAMRTGPFGSNLLHSEFMPEGNVAVLGIDNAVQNRFAWDERRFISNEKYQELQNYRIFPGDVIVTIMGTIGRSAVIPDDIGVAINTKHLAAITLNREVANPLFLSYVIHSSPYVLRQFANKNRGAIMSGLNLGIIKETKIKGAPIDLQNRFAEIHKNVDQLKSLYQQSLTDLESLYGTLSQRVFKGELDLSRVPMPKPPTQDVGAFSQGDQAIMPEPVAQTTPALHLPDTGELLEALENAETRKTLIAEWLEAYRQQLGDAPFSVQDFMVAASDRLTEWLQSMVEDEAVTDEQKNRLAEFYPSNDVGLDVNDYEHIKEWVFEVLATDALTQGGNKVGNRIELKAVQP